MTKYMFFAKNMSWPRDETGVMELRDHLSTWYRSIERYTVDSGGPLRALATTKAPRRLFARVRDGRIDGYGILEAEDADAAKAILDTSPFLLRYGAHLELYEMLPGVKDR